MIPAVNLLNNLFRPSTTRFTRPGRKQPESHQLTRPTVQSPTHVDIAEGIVTVHSACATLVRTPENMVRSINVLVPLVDFPIADQSEESGPDGHDTDSRVNDAECRDGIAHGHLPGGIQKPATGAHLPRSPM